MSCVFFSHICLFEREWLIIVSLSDVDCGLSVSWEPAENTRDCSEFSPKIKEKWTEPEKEVHQSVVGPVDEAFKLRTHQE